jgi:hypothetical protein
MVAGVVWLAAQCATNVRLEGRWSRGAAELCLLFVLLSCRWGDKGQGCSLFRRRRSLGRAVGQGRRDLTGSKEHVNWCVTARTSCVGDWTSRTLGRVCDGVADNANVDVGC